MKKILILLLVWTLVLSGYYLDWTKLLHYDIFEVWTLVLSGYYLDTYISVTYW